jgi:hypothetical protein
VSGHAATGYPDEKVAHWADHQEQPDGVADEPGQANQESAAQHHYAVEHLPGGKITLSKSLLGAAQHAQPDPPDQEWPHRAHADQEQHSPPEPNLPGYRHEGGDLGNEEETGSQQDHLFRVSPEQS